MESELIEIQTKIAFQDDAIHHLNLTIARQQQTIEELQRRLESLQQQLLSLTHAQEGEAAEPPPPHY